jgi:MFS family permease
LRAEAGPPGGLLNRTFVVACLANFMGWATGYCLLAMLGPFGVALGVPESLVGWSPACASLFGLLSQLGAGWLQGWSGRMLLLRLPGLLLAGASLLMLLAPSAAMLLVVSGLFGLGYGTLQTTAIVMATEAAPPARRGQAIGLYGTFTTFAVLIAPASGIAIFQQFGGPAVFVLTLGLSLATYACGLLAREPPRRASFRPRSGERLHGLVIFAGIALFGMTATWGALLTYLPLYALELGLANPGWFFTVQAIAVITLRAATGGLSDRFGQVQVLVPATVLVTVAMWGLAAHPSVPVLLALGLMHGWGYAAFPPTALALADDISTPGTRGAALAVVGSALGEFGAGVGARRSWTLGRIGR